MTNTRTNTILVAAGGTGGHLFPGIAVADELVRRDAATRVVFAGTARGLETRLVPKAGYSLELLPILPLNAISLVRTAKGVAALPWGMARAAALVRRLRPAAVLGIGGYAGGPVTLLAALLGVKAVLLEPNAKPGFTNRVLRPFVEKAACAYEEARVYFGAKGVLTGNPVRGGFASLPGRDHRPPLDPPRLRRQPGLARAERGARGRPAAPAGRRPPAPRPPDGAGHARGDRHGVSGGGPRGRGPALPRRHGAPLRRGRPRPLAQRRHDLRGADRGRQGGGARPVREVGRRPPAHATRAPSRRPGRRA